MGILEISRWRATRGITESEFGQLAVNDRGLIGQWRRGRIPQQRTLDKVKAFMDFFDREMAWEAAHGR